MEDDKSLKVKSFALTLSTLSLCVVKEVPEIIDIKGTMGIDRNLRNLTAGSKDQIIYYDTEGVIKIGDTTKEKIQSFKRNDVEVRRRISSKYARRRKN